MKKSVYSRRMVLFNVSLSMIAGRLLAADQMQKYIQKVNDKSLSKDERLEALANICHDFVREGSNLKTIAAIFKRCSWFKGAPFENVGAFAGEWPFPNQPPNDILLITVDVKIDENTSSALLYLGFPKEAKISMDEIRNVLSGNCPEKLQSIKISGCKLIK